MPIQYDRLKSRPFPVLEHTYSAKDTMLYALGLGLGLDPVDADQLRFTYEDGLKALPTMAVVLAYPGFWAKEPDTGLDWKKILHGEQWLKVHRPLPSSGTVTGQQRITEILDKGPSKGALLYSERDIKDQAGNLLATVGGVTFARGDGGFGGPSGPQPEPHKLPERAVDMAYDFKTSPQAALVYRLSGDMNPAACRSEDRRGGRLQAADPARAVHLRRGRLRAVEAHLRRRSGAPQIDAAALLCAGLSRRDDPHGGLARRQGGVVPRAGGRTRRSGVE
jgi:hypothetical protein